MAQRPVYADASPLIALARIGRLGLLATLPAPIRVTSHAWEEAAGDSTRPGAARLQEYLAAGGIAIVGEGDPAEYPRLDAGEASVLSAARVAGGAVLIDERDARRVLETDSSLKDDVPYITTVAVVILAKRTGLIDRVRPVIDELRRHGFRVSEKLYEDVLRAADELPSRKD